MSSTKESKYERVEKVAVDRDGRTVVREITVDRGQEDPGMNYQDRRPANLVSGAPTGHVPYVASVTREGRQVLEEDRRSSSSSASSETVEVNKNRPSSGQFVESGLATASRAGGGGEFGSSTKITTTTTTSRYPVTGGGRIDSRNVESRNLQESRIAESERSSILRGGEEVQLDPRPVEILNQRTLVAADEPEILPPPPPLPRTVPIQPHREVREEHEVIRHEVHSRAAMPDSVITIPVTRIAAQMESTRSGRTFTEDRELTIPAPVVAPPIPAMQHVDFSGGASAEIHATTDVRLATEVAEISDMGPEEYARYREKVEALARQHELETSRKAAEYRNEVEHDAELIRQTLERQHIRDIEFRKNMVEAAVERQQVHNEWSNALMACLLDCLISGLV